MKFMTFPMDANLIDLMQVIDQNDFVWSLLYFHGVGVTPNGMCMQTFEDLVRQEPKGFIMTWSELFNFSKNVHQVYDCLIVGAKSIDKISNDKSEKENFDNCEIVIEAFDSSEWSFWARDKFIMKKLALVFQPKVTNGPKGSVSELFPRN